MNLSQSIKWILIDNVLMITFDFVPTGSILTYSHDHVSLFDSFIDPIWFLPYTIYNSCMSIYIVYRVLYYICYKLGDRIVQTRNYSHALLRLWFSTLKLKPFVPNHNDPCFCQFEPCFNLLKRWMDIFICTKCWTTTLDSQKSPYTQGHQSSISFIKK